MMIVAAARALAGQRVCFVGVGLPNIAVNLAKRTIAPELELVYEAGVFGARPARLPLSIGDPTIVTGATAPMLTTGAVLGIAVSNSSSSTGGVRPSLASAVRRPEPWKKKAAALPRCQSGRSTISWRMVFSSGVSCAGPASPPSAPGASHLGTGQVTLAAVLGRDEMSLFLPWVKVSGLPSA